MNGFRLAGLDPAAVLPAADAACHTMRLAFPVEAVRIDSEPQLVCNDLALGIGIVAAIRMVHSAPIVALS